MIYHYFEFSNVNITHNTHITISNLIFTIHNYFKCIIPINLLEYQINKLSILNPK